MGLPCDSDPPRGAECAAGCRSSPPRSDDANTALEELDTCVDVGFGNVRGES